MYALQKTFSCPLRFAFLYILFILKNATEKINGDKLVISKKVAIFEIKFVVETIINIDIIIAK